MHMASVGLRKALDLTKAQLQSDLEDRLKNHGSEHLQFSSSAEVPESENPAGEVIALITLTNHAIIYFCCPLNCPLN